jgi:tetrahydromethanopterin S-methyltransferase subunit B
MIVINEKYGVVLDPDTLTVGVSRPGFLLNCLDPSTGFKMQQPNREGMLSKAGFTTFFMLGVTFCVLAVAIVFIALGGGA